MGPLYIWNVQKNVVECKGGCGAVLYIWNVQKNVVECKGGCGAVIYMECSEECCMWDRYIYGMFRRML